MSSVFIFFKQLPPIVYFKSLPPPIKVSTYAYVTGLLSYNVGKAYLDSKKALELYHSKQYTTCPEKYDGSFNYELNAEEMYHNQLKKCSNDWEAAKLGASYFKWERWCDSIVFPITIVSEIVPSIVVALHGKKD